MQPSGKIAALHTRLQEKEFSCRELTRQYLDAIGRDNEKLNA